VKKVNLVSSTKCAVVLFSVFALSAVESVLTDLGVDTNPFFGKTRFSVSEMRITGYISFVGGLILWYLPEKPNE